MVISTRKKVSRYGVISYRVRLLPFLLFLPRQQPHTALISEATKIQICIEKVSFKTKKWSYVKCEFICKSIIKYVFDYYGSKLWQFSKAAIAFLSIIKCMSPKSWFHCIKLSSISNFLQMHCFERFHQWFDACFSSLEN